MKNRFYQVDAFTEDIFGGNPAGICPLNEWLSDDLMQKIASENFLPETTFYVRKGDIYEVRWFTPGAEVDLCGHATLATAFILLYHENHNGDVVNFYSPRSGNLSVSKKGELLTLNFPTDVYKEIPITDEMSRAFNFIPKKALKGKTDFVLVFDNEEQIKNIVPDLDIIARMGGRGTIATAKGDNVDFVSRFFAPQIGINEDPVTGSAHTTLTPYWSEELGKKELTAIQLSDRKGHLHCKYLGDRVEISGQCKLYMTGEIHIP